MYTQCPDCGTAFKVTAEVLKQAAGKVRCGGCRNAFNALEYLTEQMPERPVVNEPDATLPELTPEVIDTDGPLSKSISAEQSAALLDTLDQLAGSDIRIEDTGVEWRVLDEEEVAEPAADDAGLIIELNDSGELLDDNPIDELLDDNPTPIDEFLTATPEVVDAPEIFEEAADGLARTPVDQLRFDDDTPLPDEFDLDDESSYVAEADSEPQPDNEADEVDEVESEKNQPEIALSEPDDWTDILDEFEEQIDDVAAPVDLAVDPAVDPAVNDEMINDDSDEDEADEEAESDGPLDMDTQFALQAEAMGIDLSGVHELDAEPDDILEDEPAAAEETEVEEEPEADAEAEPEVEDEPEADADAEPEAEEDLEVVAEEESEADAVAEPEIEEEPDIVAELAQLELSDDEEVFIDEPIVESHAIENELAAGEADVKEDEDVNTDGLYVPPMSEDEQTVNMQIDQDLMALAIEDEDGFASTIVIPAKETEQKAPQEPSDEVDDPDEEVGFETIIMEGEYVRSALDNEKLAADSAAAAGLADLAHTRVLDHSQLSGSKRFGLIGGVVLLVLLLGVQLMHQSREALATIPAFSNTVGQIYRAIGQPVQPAWNVTGWRFEATKGSPAGEPEELMIYSRLGNNSDGALPYPLINISLTDRFEETIGSRVLDPSEYLANDLDPRKLVEPGDTFNAVITIESEAADATGFKLNVCYRLSDGQLRCAIDDFK